MHVLSVNVGQPKQVEWRGETVTTSIFKEPVSGRVGVRPHNVDGDAQADLSVHGGPNKAVYAYPSEHYPFWQAELGEEFPWGMFGENLTTSGLMETELLIGDELEIGTARFRVTEPRMPCSKLVLRFRRPDMGKRFLRSGRSGFYLAVVTSGEIGAGDEVEHSRSHGYDVSVADITRLYSTDRDNVDLLRRAVDLPILDVSWRGYFQHQLERIAT